MEEESTDTNDTQATLDDGVAELARLIAWLYRREASSPHPAEGEQATHRFPGSAFDVSLPIRVA